MDKGNVTVKELVNALALKREEKIKQVEILDVYTEDWSDYFGMNLMMRPSTLCDKDFNWHSEKGIIKNLDLVLQEFVNFRGLTPLKTCIIGPPLCGKSVISKAIEEAWNYQAFNMREISNSELKGKERQARDY